MAEYPVRFKETGELFNTLSEAITEAETGGYDTFTLEIIGDVTETGDIPITSNITILGAEGSHTATISLLVQDSGSLTLGSDMNTNPLTILKSVKVMDGEIYIKDGIILISSDYSLDLSSPNAIGTISGGHFEGDKGAVSLVNGARISEISGGMFLGRNETIYLSDTDTRIDKITGGSFYQIDESVDLHGQTIFMQNNSTIGEISGGYFEAVRNCAIAMFRSSHIEEISGGEFVVTRIGSIAEDNRNSAVLIEGETSLTSIGTISGGHFRGTNFGILVINFDAQAQIDRITGGTIEGTIALQNDVDCVIIEISGGKFKGSQGIFNAGKIELIGGNADIIGKTSSGIFNFTVGEINEISGGMIVSEQLSSSGIANSGTIQLISGGTIIGGLHAINCTTINPGMLEKITGGVFWGKIDAAISLDSPLQLEPELGAIKGFGRYWGNDGVIFNNDSLVIYPVNKKTGATYQMSIDTEPVADIKETEFKYLMFDIPPGFYIVTVNGSHAAITGAGIYEEGETVTVNASNSKGYIFAGWTADDGVDFADASETTTTFIMPAKDVTVTANWKVLYTVTVYNSYAVNTGTGTYEEGETVTINAGSRRNYAFTGWKTDDGLDFNNAKKATTTFIMPAKDVTVTATWCYRFSNSC